MRAGRGRPGLAAAARVARWIGGWPARRVGLAAVAGALLVGAALLGRVAPLQAQEGEAPEATGASGVSIRMDDLVGLITYSIVDRLELQVSHLDAAATYDVVVSSSNAPALGIGGCGTPAQTETVTGATAQNLYFIVYACGVGAGTVTAEVRRAGAATAEVAVSQRMTVQPIPDYVPADERPVKGAAVAQVGTPGIVPDLQHERWATSFKMTWGKPADGGVTLSGYGVLMWKGSEPQPGWGTAESIAPTPRSKEYTGLELDTVYKFLIHACSEDDNNPPRCGWWTDVHEVRTGKRPDPPHTISFDQKKTTSARVRWSAAANTGGVPLTGFQIRYWRPSDPSNSRTVMVDSASAWSTTLTGLTAGTAYEAKLRSCNDESNCTVGAWSADHSFETPRDARTPPGPVRELKFTSRGDHTVALGWAAPSSSGSAALASYHVQHRVYEGPNREPWTQVGHDDVLSGTSHTIGGLTNGTWYDVQVRACNRDNLCGAWTVVDAPVYPGAVVGSAHLSPASAAIERGQRQKFEIHNIPVGKTAYAHLTGPIQPERRCDTRTGGAVGPRAPTPSTGPGYYDSLWIEGCADGYGWLRVVDANDDELYARATILVGPIAPGQVARPVVRARDAALHVDWEAPSTGGTPTHYVVGYRAGASGAWTETEVRSGTSTTITELTNGTSYQVRVRAVNAKGDGDWSETVTGTPSAAPGEPPETSPPGTTPSPPPSCESLPISPPPVPSSLDAPANLDLSPLLTTRHALLAWAPVSGAAKYKVEIRRLEQGTWGTWGPPNLSGNVANSGEVTGHTCYTIDLDHIVQILQDRMLPDSTKGLGTNAAFGFQVKAINGDKESDFSNELIVIDFSRAYANGDSRDYPIEGQGQAEVNWQRADQVLGSNYRSGRYSFRYRELRQKAAPGTSGFVHHSKPKWQPDAYVPLGTTTDNPITGLTEGSIYGIQIRLYNTGPGGTSSVYAARDIYAWPHHQSAYDSQDTVATHDFVWPPIRRATSGHLIVYRYRICTDTFTFPAYTKPGSTTLYKAGDPAQWVPYINHALRQWQYATNGLVQMIHEVDAQGNSLPCSSTLEFLTKIADEYNLRKGQGKTDSEIDTYIASLLKSLKEKGIKGRRLGDALASDLKLSEILMIDDVSGPIGSLKDRVFHNVSADVGIPRCSAGCALPEVHPDPENSSGPPIRTADIYLKRGSHWAENNTFLNLGGVEQIRLNTCPGTNPDIDDDHYNRPYSTLVHESGHALGLGHPTNLGPIMSYTQGVPRCSPHPFDVLALMVLYQSRGERSV